MLDSNPNQFTTQPLSVEKFLNALNSKIVSHAGTNYYISNLESNI